MPARKSVFTGHWAAIAAGHSSGASLQAAFGPVVTARPISNWNAGECRWDSAGLLRARTKACVVGGGLASRPRHPTVRLNCFWYFAGVIPVRQLKIRVKWLCDENPRSSAMLARGESVLSVSSDCQIRLRFTKRPILKPVECRNFLAK